MAARNADLGLLGVETDHAEPIVILVILAILVIIVIVVKKRRLGRLDRDSRRLYFGVFGLGSADRTFEVGALARFRLGLQLGLALASRAA